ncbi:beta-galactosidase [Alienimonas sp. DA493]|uniref:GH39 family glycosyl hydrolase n=1 Tax=Alienimonas sp. DA493 TaxID=3373605 RepID=UPI00375403CD
MPRRRPAGLVATVLLAAVGVIDDRPAPAAPPAGAAVGWSPFGIGSCHVNGRSAEDLARWMPQMAAIDLHVYRTPHTSWNAVEPEPGVFDWTALDAQMEYLDKRGFQYGALLLGNPRWNEADPPGHLPVNNVAGWSNYVTQLARRLKGRVRRYEVWNEPPNFTGEDQTPADYAKLVVAAHDAAKAVDPDCQIGLAAKSAHINYLEQVILAGAKDHFDYIVLHPYEALDGVAENAGTEAVFMNVVPVVRKMLAAQNPAKADVPIVYTELGVNAENKGADVQAHALVKAYVMGIASGVECIQWFEGRDGDSGPMGLLDRNGVARPAYTALATLIDRLGQRPQPLGWVLLNDRHHAFLFDGADGPVLATWGDAGVSDRYDFGRDVRVVDPLTGHMTTQRSLELTTAPALVLDPPPALIDRAKANRGEPFPWGGNDPGSPAEYAAADEVFLEFGEEVVERGLHTRSAAGLTEAVVAYGGSARAGNVPGGNVFIVDPHFLSYESTPIEITVEVRRNPENVNSGFKLVYESPDGFKTAGGWYTVPDNTQWHTKTWRIDDPQFVNYWGFNFILESDGDVYNKYLIRRVSVRKLDQ